MLATPRKQRKQFVGPAEHTEELHRNFLDRDAIESVSEVEEVSFSVSISISEIFKSILFIHHFKCSLKPTKDDCLI